MLLLGVIRVALAVLGWLTDSPSGRAGCNRTRGSPSSRSPRRSLSVWCCSASESGRSWSPEKPGARDLNAMPQLQQPSRNFRRED